jgi:hypothetical protein
MTNDNTCAWTQETCSESPVPNRSYCEHHVWMVYQKGTALGRRNRDKQRADRVYTLTSLLDEAVRELEESGEL